MINSNRFFISYALFAMPLAMVALPLYLMLPNFYGQTLGVNLTLLGSILFLSRLADAACDPFIGRIVDQFGHYQRWMVGASLLLCVGMVVLFLPTQSNTPGLMLYLAAGLVFVYAGFSVGTIAYYALGTQIAKSTTQRTQLSAQREVFGLLGILLASFVPYMLGSYTAYTGFFVGCVLLACMTLYRTERAERVSSKLTSSSWAQVLSNPLFKKWLVIQALCGLSASVSATLMLFYISDVIKKSDWAPGYLVMYFLSAAISTWLWAKIAIRLGKPKAWCLGVIMSVIFFSATFFLGASNYIAFMAVCVLTGLTLGADLVLPPAFVADVIGNDQTLSGQYFGVWTALNKICLALGSLALPLWMWLGDHMASTQALVCIYVGVPVFLRIIAAYKLYQFPLKSIGD
jgi:glycoside/pentoside/hexuronide:cation symporter, GPH family